MVSEGVAVVVEEVATSLVTGFACDVPRARRAARREREYMFRGSMVDALESEELDEKELLAQ